MMRAMRAVFSTICLLLVVIYVFAIIFTQMLAGTDAEQQLAGSFDSVPQAMVCLLLDGIFNSQAGLIYKLLDIHWSYFVCIMVYESIACLTVMNMLLGVICNEITHVAKQETEARLLEKIRTRLHEILLHLDVDRDGMISIVEFGQLVSKTDVLREMHALGVDVFGLIECGDFIFLDKGYALPFDDFVEAVLRFRTSNVCTVKDTVDIRLSFIYEIRKLEARLRRQLRFLAPRAADKD
jgi:hypothetical protein